MTNATHDLIARLKLGAVSHAEMVATVQALIAVNETLQRERDEAVAELGTPQRKLARLHPIASEETADLARPLPDKP